MDLRIRTMFDGISSSVNHGCLYYIPPNHLSDFEFFLSTKSEKYVVYSSNFQIVVRTMFFKFSWFKHRLELFVYKSTCTIIVLCWGKIKFLKFLKNL